MEKISRKKSNDPVQESLRSRKDKWNSMVKDLISKIIAFKRGVNGRGDSQYGLPPSNIKDPFPSEISSFLNTLSSNFEEVAREAARIQADQASYSQNRKKPKTASINNTIKLGNNSFDTLLAITSEEQEKGLMYVEYPPPVMTFVYSSPRINRFWMKNTPSPLDVVFCLDGKISQICYGEPYSTEVIGKFEYSDLVVELPFGTCKKLGISVGDQVELKK